MQTTLTNLVTHKMRWDGFSLYIISCEEGTVSVEISDTSPDPHHNVLAYICNLWVESQHRGKGVATQLMQLAERIALKNGHKQVWLRWSWRESADFVCEWYERNGYKEQGFGNTASLYMKELSASKE